MKDICGNYIFSITNKDLYHWSEDSESIAYGLLFFLLRLNLYYPYIDNVMVQNASSYLRRRIRLNERVIDRSFTWDETKEGHEFWGDLNSKFYDKALEMQEIYRPNKSMFWKKGLLI